MNRSTPEMELPQHATSRVFRTDIQALRGVAVLMVVLYHAGGVLSGGFVGVDVFLVISGFVIGRALLTSLRSSDSIDLRSFYLRRVRRLLPALAAMLVIVIVLSSLLAPLGPDQDLIRGTGVAAGFISANLFLFLNGGGGYFDAAPSSNPLLHTWSLSLEEQFYLVFPLLLMIGWRIGRGRLGRGRPGRRRSGRDRSGRGHRDRGVGDPARSTGLVVTGLLIASAILCVILTGMGPDRARLAFYSPLTRAWEFLAGVVILLIPAIPSAAARRTVLVAGVGLIAFCGITYSDATAFPGLAAMLPVIGAVMIIHAGSVPGFDRGPDADVSAGGTWGKVLRPLVSLGDISYSWYLWHWPLIVFAGALFPRAGRAPVLVAAIVSLGPAILSYRLLEQRLRLSERITRRRTVILAGACVMAPLISIVPSMLSMDLVLRLPGAARATAAGEPHIDVLNGCNSPTPLDERDARVRARCTFGHHGVDRTSGGGGDRRDGSGGPTGGAHRPRRIVLVGDSNAGHLSEGLIGAVDTTGASLEIVTNSACPVFALDDDDGNTPACEGFLEGTFDEIHRDPPDTVVVASRTLVYLTRSWFRRRNLPLAPGTTVDDRTVTVQRALEETLADLRDTGARVVLIQNLPSPGNRLDLDRCSRLAASLSLSLCGQERFGVDRISLLARANRIESLAASRTGTTSVDLSETVCPGGGCALERSGALVWWDDSHITVEESQRLAPALAEALDT